MDMPLFLKAMLVGLSIAAPVGPIGLLTIQRTLQFGLPVGLATGLGAAAADACYGAVGAYGVRALIDALQAARLPLAAAGGALLLWMAWSTWRSAPAERAATVGDGAAPTGPGLAAAFGGTFVLTLSNPATIVSFIAVFGMLAAQGGAVASPAWMVAGVLLGSALWWLLLTGSVGLLRARVDAAWQRRINRVSALVLAAFALWQWSWLLPGATAPGSATS